MEKIAQQQAERKIEDTLTYLSKESKMIVLANLLNKVVKEE